MQSHLFDFGIFPPLSFFVCLVHIFSLKAVIHVLIWSWLEYHFRVDWAKPSFNNAFNRLCCHSRIKTTWMFPFYFVLCISWKWLNLGLWFSFIFPGLTLTQLSKMNKTFCCSEKRMCYLITSLNIYYWKKERTTVKIWLRSRFRNVLLN